LCRHHRRRRRRDCRCIWIVCRKASEKSLSNTTGNRVPSAPPTTKESTRKANRSSTSKAKTSNSTTKRSSCVLVSKRKSRRDSLRSGRSLVGARQAIQCLAVRLAILKRTVKRSRFMSAICACIITIRFSASSILTL
jgi:hypothetical protein